MTFRSEWKNLSRTWNIDSILFPISFVCWIFSFLCTLSLFHLPSPLSIILLSILLFLMTPHLFPASLYLPDSFPLFMALYILLSISSAGLFSSKLSLKGYLISSSFPAQSPFLPFILLSNKNQAFIWTSPLQFLIFLPSLLLSLALFHNLFL